DLADDRRFVEGFAAALDAEARAAGVLAVTGASSVPGISAAAVAELRPEFASVDRTRIAIAPGAMGARGLATVTAVRSCTGRPLPGGGHGWQGLHRHIIGCTGTPWLKRRWFAAADVPDLTVLPGGGQVSFAAGLAIGPTQLALCALSWAVRWGWLREPT